MLVFLFLSEILYECPAIFSLIMCVCGRLLIRVSLSLCDCISVRLYCHSLYVYMYVFWSAYLYFSLSQCAVIWSLIVRVYVLLLIPLSLWGWARTHRGSTGTQKVAPVCSLINRIWCIVSSGCTTHRFPNVLASTQIYFWTLRTKGDRVSGHFLFWNFDKQFVIVILSCRWA